MLPASLLGGQPNLVVEQIFSQTWVPDGDAIVRNYIFIDVGNWGSASAAASSLHFKMRDLTGRTADSAGAGTGVGYTAEGWIDTPAVPAGDSVRLQIPVIAYMTGNSVPGAMGRYHVFAIADGLNGVAESNEWDNSLEGEVFGGEAKLS